MDIIAKITGIEYKIHVKEELKKFSPAEFNINELPASFILEDKNVSFAISKWVSPKRTRSYPYERVYNTLSSTKKITIIPIVKDERFPEGSQPSRSSPATKPATRLCRKRKCRSRNTWMFARATRRPMPASPSAC